jgi:hypothetical protein
VSERSDELRRQRELLRENLAWLEREIAREEGIAAQEAPPPQAPPRLSQPPSSASASDRDRDAEAILAEYRTSAPAVESQTKRGCILYFAVALVLFLGVAGVLIFFYARARQGH